MRKKALAIRIDPDLLRRLDTLQEKLEHRPTRTTLIEDAIEGLLDRHGVGRVKASDRKRPHGR
jgi:predicted transcriptional regulator